MQARISTFPKSRTFAASLPAQHTLIPMDLATSQDSSRGSWRRVKVIEKTTNLGFLDSFHDNDSEHMILTCAVTDE